MAETKKTAVAKPVAKVAAANAADVKKEEVKAEAVKEAPKAEVKKPEAKKAPAKKETAKKETVKKETTKKAAKKTTAKNAEPAKTKAKKAVDAEVVVQFSGNDYTMEKLVSIAQDVWKYDLNRKPEDFKTVKLYVKPEEKTVYYVINGDVSGSFGI